MASIYCDDRTIVEWRQRNVVVAFDMLKQRRPFPYIPIRCNNGINDEAESLRVMKGGKVLVNENTGVDGKRGRMSLSRLETYQGTDETLGSISSCL